MNITENKAKNGLTTRQILTLLMLPKCGRKTALKIASAAQGMEMGSDYDLADFLTYCRENGRVRRMVEYTQKDVMNAARKADHIIEDSQREGVGIIGFYDIGFPSRLRGLVSENGSVDPPAVLYYKGDLSIAEMPSIAIIGTREATKEGVVAGEVFGKMFAEKGFNIVSGLALGCDSAGHRGALKGNGVTTSFLAHGLDTVYPAENTELARSIVENGGLLMSEYPIGERVIPNRFVERDRLQAGLADATLVIQTGEHGGTMHAAKATLAAHKPLFVVRYKSDMLMLHDKVRGNSLLASLGARYLTAENADDVIAELLASKSASPSVKDTSVGQGQITMEF